ncbi:MAG: hypothetical protein R6W99_03745, partial [Clostridia bacterium]
MDMLWNLDKLYKSFEDPGLEADIAKAAGMLGELRNVCEVGFVDTGNAYEKLADFIEKSNLLSDLLGNVYSFASLTYAVDTSNMKALGIIERVEKMIPQLAVIEVQFTRWLTKLEDIEYKGIVGEHRFAVGERLRNAKYMLDDKCEMIIATMKNTGS